MNWKTTAAGILAGLVPTIQGLADSLSKGGTVHWYPLLLGLGIMALGVLAKDANGKVAKP